MANITFKLSNGKVISAYAASGLAAGRYLNVDVTGVATADSPQQFVNAANVAVTDIYTDCASGTIEVISNSIPTGIHIDMAVQQKTANMRPAPNFGFKAGSTIMLKVISAMA